MAKQKKAKDLFTASEIARFCQVDLKTIHNWADRGEVRHFRTPGRHLRFRREDVLEFLRKYGYPLPSELSPGKRSVLVIDDTGADPTDRASQLSDKFELRGSGDPLDALIGLGAQAPDVVVLDTQLANLDGLCLARAIAHNPATKHVRVVVYSANSEREKEALDSGVAAFVPKPREAKLIETLEALLDVQ